MQRAPSVINKLSFFFTYTLNHSPIPDIFIYKKKKKKHQVDIYELIETMGNLYNNIVKINERTSTPVYAFICVYIVYCIIFSFFLFLFSFLILI